MRKLLPIFGLCAVALMSAPAHADIKIGVILDLTGGAASVGIPSKNGMALWPTQIAGEKVDIILLDSATDPTQGVKNARRLLDEDHVDLVAGGLITPVSAAIVDMIAASKTPQIAFGPIPVPQARKFWGFQMAHSVDVMCQAVVDHMKKNGVKTVGFLGYTDAWGQSWLDELKQLAPAAGIEIVAVERFARTDSSVTAQALKLALAKPDAVLIGASGSGGALPHIALVDRNYKGKIYHTHGSASRALISVGKEAVEGAYVVSGPAMVAEILPENHPSKAIALKFATEYDKVYGKDSRDQFAASAFDIGIVLERAVPIALKKGRPGTAEFRAALRDAIEGVGPLPISQGLIRYTRDDHTGYTRDSGVMLKIVKGEWKIEP